MEQGRPLLGGSQQHYRIMGRRAMATMADYREQQYEKGGPLREYDRRVRAGRLTNDDHQRTLVQALQDLHDDLMNYTPSKVVQPTIESLQPKKKSFLGSLFGGGGSETLRMTPSKNLPKGLYMYGNVGSGKTMLMDLFYDTLPENIHSKTRIHFHNFMQEVHKEVHKIKILHGNDIDAIPFVAAHIAEHATVLCFDEFQVTDVADAMILRRMVESLMAHGVVLVTTSNRHPKQLYKNGIQRESFVPCINLLIDHLRIINLDSTTDYRKIPRPPSGVYHHPLDAAARRHAEHWFRFLGDIDNDPPHRASHTVWGREIEVPRASGRACWFSFNDLMGKATGAADYLELVRSYDAFIVTDVPGMNVRSRDLARRFITFLDAAYESHAKLVLTTAVPLTQLFMNEDEIGQALGDASAKGDRKAQQAQADGASVNDAMRSLMDDLGLNMDTLKKSSIFTGDEEAFAFARALSRLTEMGSQEWVDRGLGLEHRGGKKDAESWAKTRSSYMQDSY
ncbi:ATPase [Friedmanniomyces endolithicus]|nr:ATPase [Friedmanniomyces endolithicus]